MALIEEKVNYVINVDGNQRTYHVNLLKAYISQENDDIPQPEIAIAVLDEDNQIDEVNCIPTLPAAEVEEGISDIKMNPAQSETAIAVLDEHNQTDEVNWRPMLPAGEEKEGISDIKINPTQPETVIAVLDEDNQTD